MAYGLVVNGVSVTAETVDEVLALTEVVGRGDRRVVVATPPEPRLLAPTTLVKVPGARHCKVCKSPDHDSRTHGRESRGTPGKGAAAAAEDP